jgi:hypothetical protein
MRFTIPRTAGVSSTTTVCRMRRKPSPLTQAMCRRPVPRGLRRKVIFNFLPAMLVP